MYESRELQSVQRFVMLLSLTQLENQKPVDFLFQSAVTNQTKYTKDEKHSHAARNADSDSFFYLVLVSGIKYARTHVDCGGGTATRYFGIFRKFAHDIRCVRLNPSIFHIASTSVVDWYAGSRTFAAVGYESGGKLPKFFKQILIEHWVRPLYRLGNLEL